LTVLDCEGAGAGACAEGAADEADGAVGADDTAGADEDGAALLCALQPTSAAVSMRIKPRANQERFVFDITESLLLFDRLQTVGELRGYRKTDGLYVSRTGFCQNRQRYKIFEPNSKHQPDGLRRASHFPTEPNAPHRQRGRAFSGACCRRQGCAASSPGRRLFITRAQKSEHQAVFVHRVVSR
jgi:hypothetical protein